MLMTSIGVQEEHMAVKPTMSLNNMVTSSTLVGAMVSPKI